MKRKMLDVRGKEPNVKFYKDELGRTRVIRPSPEEKKLRELRELEMLMARGKYPTPKANVEEIIKRPEGSGLLKKIPKPKPLPPFKG